MFGDDEQSDAWVALEASSPTSRHRPSLTPTPESRSGRRLFWSHRQRSGGFLMR